jgi:hypothetical protein
MQLRKLIHVFLVVPAVVTIGCGSASAPVVGASRPSAPPAAVRIAALVDKTASTSWTRVPVVRVEDFEPLLALLARRGGELAVGLIRDESNRGLLRLKIPRAPAAPTPPNPHQNPFLLAEARAAYEIGLRRHHEHIEEWRREVSGRLADFRAKLGPLLEVEADATRTDIWGALRRAELFLNEPQSSGLVAPHNWILLVSDGEDNARRPKVALRSGARLLLINSSAMLGALAELKPLAFESFPAATAYLVAEEK